MTGPLSYEITLEDGRIVRRHLDHVRRRSSRPLIDHDFGDTPSPEPDSVDTSPLPASSTELAESSAATGSTETEPTAVAEQAETHDPAPAQETSEPVQEGRRYPVRVRHPNRFAPYISH